MQKAPKDYIQWSANNFRFNAWRNNRNMIFFPYKMDKYNMWRVKFKSENGDRGSFYPESYGDEYERIISYIFDVTVRDIRKESRKYNAVKFRRFYLFPTEKDANDFIVNYLEPLQLASRLTNNY